MLDLDLLERFEKMAADSKNPPGPQRFANDVNLWETWKQNGEKPEDLRPLMSNFRGLIRNHANRWVAGVDLPPAAIHAEFNKSALDAFRTYDPTKGTKLSTWVSNRLRSAQRWITSNQNVGRIQEKRLYKIGLFNNAVSSLDNELGREPTTQELSDHLGWSEPEIGRMQMELRKATPMGHGADGFDPTVVMPDRDTEILNLIRFELDPEEMLAYEYLVGYGGKPVLRPGEIATKLGWSPSKVSHVKNRIAAKIEKFRR